jgi:hypothetical protein
MLEHASLFIHGWTRSIQADGLEAWTRSIVDADGRQLGFVAYQRLAANSWLFWLRKIRLDVYETEDASHLLSLMRSWTMRSIWDLYDAEERHIGCIYPKSLVASDGSLLGFLDMETRNQGRILDHAGGVLATFTRCASRIELTFASEPTGNPFLRMLMLGAILALDPEPQGA